MTKTRRLTLSIKLLIVIIGGLAFSTVIFFLNVYIISSYLQNVYLSDENTKQRNDEHIENFAEYVKKNKVGASDIKSILTWQEKENNVYILVYENDEIIYDSTWWAGRRNRNFIDKFAITDKDTGDMVISETEKKEILRQIKLKREAGNVDKNNGGTTTETGNETSFMTTETTEDTVATTEKSTETTEDTTATTEKSAEVTEDTTATTEKSAETTKQKSEQYADYNNNSDKKRYDYKEPKYYVVTEDSKTEESQQYGFYPIKFADGIYDVCILDYSESTVYGYCLIVSFFFSCLVLVAIIVIYHRREIKRVIRLTNEVKNIESLDIDNPISLKGRDEIYDLSVSVDNMRNRIIDKMGEEKAAWQANSDLVTAMAHDIRTPLTVLAGYLDLIKNKDYSSEEELFQYINISVDKAEQLRDLSDKLFRYFYVYSKGDDNIVLEEFDAAGLFDQLIGEYVILLEEKGYTFKIDTFNHAANIKIDIQYLKRLTDNIFTNIRKYADKSKPVKITHTLHRDKVSMRVRNEISKERNTAESTRIGLQTCEKIAEQMGGRFRTEEKGTVYTVYIEFPIVKKENKKENISE